MKSSRLISLVFSFVLLCSLFSGCKSKEAERKKAEELTFKKERVDKINQRLNEINAEIDRLEKAIADLNRDVDNYIFNARSGIVSIKNSQKDIQKSMIELHNYIIPPEPTRQPGLHWFVKLLILLIIIIAIVFAVMLWRGRQKESEEEEFSFEEESSYNEDTGEHEDEK